MDKRELDPHKPCKVSVKILGSGDMLFDAIYPNERAALEWIKRQVDDFNGIQRQLHTGKIQQERYVHDGIVEVTLTDNLRQFKNTGLFAVYKIFNVEVEASATPTQEKMF